MSAVSLHLLVYGMLLLWSAVGGLCGRSLNFYRREGKFFFFYIMHAQVSGRMASSFAFFGRAVGLREMQMCLPLWACSQTYCHLSMEYWRSLDFFSLVIDAIFLFSEVRHYLIYRKFFSIVLNNFFIYC